LLDWLQGEFNVAKKKSAPKLCPLPQIPLLSEAKLTTVNEPSSFAIGIVGDAGVRGTAQQPRLFVGMILILIFAEVLGLSTFSSH